MNYATVGFSFALTVVVSVNLAVLSMDAHVPLVARDALKDVALLVTLAVPQVILVAPVKAVSCDQLKLYPVQLLFFSATSKIPYE